MKACGPSLVLLERFAGESHEDRLRVHPLASKFNAWKERPGSAFRTLKMLNNVCEHYYCCCQ